MLNIEVGQVWQETNPHKEWLREQLTVEKIEGDYVEFKEKDGLYHKSLLNDWYTLKDKRA